MRRRITTALAILITTAASMAAGPLPATAAPTSAMIVAVANATSLNQVITNITIWLGSLLGGLATLLATIGGVRYLVANGDPGEVIKAKETLKYAAVGYGVAVLAPLLLTILKGFVG